MRCPIRPSQTCTYARCVASMCSHEQVARVMLENGAAVDAANNEGYTSLMLACFGNHDQVARDLIKAGADVNAATNSGFTALMVAAQNGHDLVARALLKAGASLEAKNNGGLTVFMMCQHNTELFKILRAFRRLRMCRDVVRVRPYIKHWIRDYAETRYAPDSTATHYTGLEIAGRVQEAEAVKTIEYVRQLENTLKRKLVDGQAMIDEAYNVAKHICGM